MSTTSLEEVAAAAPTGLRWFQLYVLKDRKLTLEIVKRAEVAGFKALVVTVDAPVLGRREADVKNKFALPPHLTIGNFQHLGGQLATGVNGGRVSSETNRGKYSASSSGSGGGNESSGSRLTSYFASLMDESLTWDDIIWLRKQCKMKIVVKGVITAEDALLSVWHGVDGIWVSNHGARQLDTTPATIEALPEICKAVAGRVEVYLDGGIMRGTDVVKVSCESQSLSAV